MRFIGTRDNLPVHLQRMYGGIVTESEVPPPPWPQLPVPHLVVSGDTVIEVIQNGLDLDLDDCISSDDINWEDYDEDCE
jgi:hypothetical protein